MALTADQRAFLARVKAAAPTVEGRGVPAAVMVAQAIIESGWGQSGLTQLGNALFGIKAQPGYVGRVYSGTTYEVEAGHSVRHQGTNRVYPSRDVALAGGADRATIFRAYDSFEQSIQDHATFFQANSRYHPCLDAYAARRDPFEFAACIHQAGYATSLTYTQTIVAAMRVYAAEFLPAALPAQAIRVLIGGSVLPEALVRFLDGRIFVHVRAFEQVGKRVQWNLAQRTVEVT